MSGTVCRFCGELVDLSRRMGSIRYCSDECKRKQHNRARCEKRRVGRKAMECGHCGATMPLDTHLQQRYCNARCREAPSRVPLRNDEARHERAKGQQREYMRRMYRTPEGKAKQYKRNKAYMDRRKAGLQPGDGQ